MYSKFKINNIGGSNFIHYIDSGKKQMEKYKKPILCILSEQLNKEKIDGSNLQRNWFPTIDADIFLSHSHLDKNYALGLTGWLYEKFGLVTFVDSFIWGSADELLREIDNEHCKSTNNNNLYDYNKRNYSTSHVHMMLSIAISKAIDNIECVFLLNTDNSTLKKTNYKNPTRYTSSPWLYYEIEQTANLIRKQPLKRANIIRESKSEQRIAINDAYSLNVEYDVTKALGNFVDLSYQDLTSWNNNYFALKSKPTHPLDILYEQAGIHKKIT